MKRWLLRIAVVLSALMVLATGGWWMWRVVWSGEYLWNALKKGDADRTRLAFALGADPNARNQEGIPPIIQALDADRTDILEIVIDHGGDMEIVSPHSGATPLILALVSLRPEMVRILAENGANLEARTKRGIFFAYVSEPDLSSDYKYTTMRVLEGAGRRKRSTNGGLDTPLHLAAALDKMGAENVTILLAAGADINSRNARGETPLYRSLENGRPAITEALVEAGADVNLSDDYGRTPLYRAVLNRYIEANETPVYGGVLGRNIVVIRLLLRAGADPNLPTKKYNNNALPYFSQVEFPPGTTPLHLAAMMMNKEVAKLLLHSGANPNLRDKRDRTPLALWPELAEIVKEVEALRLRSGQALRLRSGQALRLRSGQAAKAGRKHPAQPKVATP